MDVAGVIIFYERLLDLTVYELRAPPRFTGHSASRDDLERIKEIIMQHMNELAVSMSALDVLNAYERAFVNCRDVGDFIYHGEPMKTAEQLNLWFDEVKTTSTDRIEIRPRGQIVAMIHEMSPADRARYVMAIVENAKALVGMEKLTVA